MAELSLQDRHAPRKRLGGALQADGAVGEPGLLLVQGDGESHPHCGMAAERAESGLQQRHH